MKTVSVEVKAETRGQPGAATQLRTCLEGTLELDFCYLSFLTASLGTVPPFTFTACFHDTCCLTRGSRARSRAGLADSLRLL